MANIIITQDGEGYRVESNDVNSKTGWDIHYVWPQDIKSVQRNGLIEFSFKDDRIPWEVSHDGYQNTWKIDSVLGVVPDDLDHLVGLLANLKG